MTVSDNMGTKAADSTVAAATENVPRSDDSVPLNMITQGHHRAASAADAPAFALPPFVRRHFVQSDDRFYYRQTPERLAFTSSAEGLRAKEVSVAVATAMVELAQSRGWSSVRVTGTQEFRRLIWTAATKRGLAVDGYSPSPGERAAFSPPAPTRGKDLLAARVAELFTAERLAPLTPEDRAKFRELYEQAKARLEGRERASTHTGREGRPERAIRSR